jgi:aminopeptidase C
VGHVVNIVGYHLNKQGRIDRVKIENTWGRYEGSSGFYSVSWDDLKTMYVAISIPDGFNFANAQKMNGEKLVD